MIAWLWCAVSWAMSAEEAVRAALKADLSLVEAEAGLEAAEARLRAARGLQHNPEAAVAADLGGERLELDLSQPFSLSGEGLWDRQAAEASVGQRQAELELRRLDVAAGARRDWSRLCAAEALLELAQQQRGLATGLRGAAEARVSAGEAPQLELQLARLAEAQAAAVWIESLSSRDAARAALVARTGLPSAEAKGDPLAALGSTGTGEGGLAQRAAEEARREAEAQLRAAKAGALPPVALGLKVQREGEGLWWGPSLSMELPVWNQGGAGRGEAAAALAVAERRASLKQLESAEAAKAAIERRALLEGVGASLGAGPARDAEQALAAVADAVAAGELDLLQASLLRAQIQEGQRGWVLARLAEAEARLDAALALQDPGLLVP